jgi:DNA-binding FadR family transcriptional regulator
MRISDSTEKLAMSLQSEDLFRIKRSDIVAESIKQFIVSQNLKPGDRLPPEKDLIQSFGCSRGTIRECLKSLEVQGLVEVLPGRSGGVRVCAVPYRRAMQLLANYLHFKDLSGTQIYQIRQEVEPLLAESVVGLLKPEDFKLLDKEIQVCKLYLEDEHETNRSKCHEAELEFHNILANACPNPFLAFFCRFINDVILHFIVLKKFGPTLRINFAKSNLKYHISLVKAYQKEDRQRVRKLMEDHMNDAAKFIAGVEAVFEQGLIKRSETTL